MSARLTAIAVAVSAALWPAAAAAQVKFNPAPPSVPPPVFVTGPTNLIQTMYKPVDKLEGPATTRPAVSPNDLAAIGVRLAEVMQEALKNQAAPMPVGAAAVRTKPAARKRGGTSPGTSTAPAPKLVEIAVDDPRADRPAVPAAEGRVRLRWSDRIELTWPAGIETLHDGAPGARLPLIWR